MAEAQTGMEAAMIRLLLLIILLACCCRAQGKGKDKPDISTNKPPVKVEKEHKAEHKANKIIILERDKGSKKESDWKTAKEYPLMFNNNKKAKKVK
jgi:hypothetical protein